MSSNEGFTLNEFNDVAVKLCNFPPLLAPLLFQRIAGNLTGKISCEQFEEYEMTILSYVFTDFIRKK